MAVYQTDGSKSPKTSYFIPDYPLMLYTYNIMKHNKIFDHKTLSVTSKLCELNIFNFEFWNTRNTLITAFYSKFQTNKDKRLYMIEYEKISIVEPRTLNLLFCTVKCHRLKDFAYMEINWIRKCMLIDCKNFQVWHALQVFANLHNVKPKHLWFLHNIMERNERNLHLWNFFMFYIKKTRNFAWLKKFTDTYIAKNSANNSAWSCRFSVFKDSVSASTIESEISYAISCLNRQDNEAPITYLFAFRNTPYFIDVCTRTRKLKKDDHYKFLMITHIIEKNLNDLQDLAKKLYKDIKQKKGPKYIYITQLMTFSGIKD